jgi:WD40 repeat protein/serine/threonine protein kinase
MIGQMIAHYRIIDKLGSGGMGEVYLAQDLRLGRKVALKILSSRWTAMEERLLRFQQEAQTASALSHPNILTIFDIGQVESIHFIATEFIDGQTLRGLQPEARWDLQDAIEVTLQIASGLAAAHKSGIVHCDIKPDNLMLRADGLVKILDFGIARLADRPNSVPVAATTGLALRGNEITGTALYMSPEQVRGESLDARTDIFSLGVVFYEMLTGRRPFEGENVAAVFQAILDEEPLALSHFRDDVPLGLEAIMRTVLEKNPEERFQEIEQLIADLQRLKSHLSPARADGTRGAKDHRVSLPQGDANQPSSHIVDASPTAAARFPGSRLQTFARRYRKRLVRIGIAAFLCLAFDLLFLQPQGGERIRDAALLVIGAMCLTLSAVPRRKALAGFRYLPKGAAFRGLLPFQEADKNRFYGRQAETRAVFEMIGRKEFRFGVLYGESGAGKTSLVKAALVPKLWEEGYTPIYCRSYKDPLAAILEECYKRSRIEYLQGEGHTDYLRRVADELGGYLVILCDQFEEFFINFKTVEDRAAFISFVARCHNGAELPVKVLLSMRSDFLYLINVEFAAHITEPLMTAKLFHLRNLDERRAAEIIEKSARYANLPFEAALVKQVARDLSESDAVPPSELQIVGEQLQNKRVFRLQEYRRAGGKEALVHSFLEDVIQASGDKEGAQLLLRCLISDENTRLTLTIDEIAKRLQRPKAPVEQLLRLFAQSRLLREIQEDNPWRYELMHEYLIERINQVTGKVMDATQRANRLLRQYLSGFAIDKTTRIPVSKLFFIRRYADLASGERMRELMNRSLLRGLGQLSLLVFAVALIATLAAAGFSLAEEWESLRLSDGHKGVVRRVAFSPDGRLLVSCGEDGRVMVWDFARRQRIATLSDHAGVVTSVIFSPDGKWFVTTGSDQTVMVWDTAGLEKVAVLLGHQYGVSSAAFSPDSRWLISNGTSQAIVWRTGSFEKAREFQAAGAYQAPLFLPDTQAFILPPDRTGDTDNFPVYDIATGKKEYRRLDDIGGWQGCALSKDGALMVNTDGMAEVRFVDLRRRKLIKKLPAHKDNGRSVAFSPDGQLIATAAAEVILWDAKRLEKILQLDHAAVVWDVAFSPDGRYLISAHGDGAILVWDVKERRRVANLNEHSAAVRAVAYSRDGRRLASSGEDESILVWNAGAGQKEAALIGHKTRVMGIAFSPDGRLLASCDSYGMLILWDIARGQPVRVTTNTDTQKVGNCLTFSPDGRRVASSQGVFDISEDRWVVTFARGQLQIPEALGFQTSSIYGADFSPDGKRLICTAAGKGGVAVFDTRNWEIVSYYQSDQLSLTAVKYSPDGNLAVVATDEGVVRLFEINPLRPIADLGHQASRIKTVAFSPDGKTVASGSDDKTLTLWDVGRRSLITRIGANAAPVISLAFSPDGKQLISGEHDSSVRLHTRYHTLWGYRLD